jgi:hypothetical protein
MSIKINLALVVFICAYLPFSHSATAQLRGSHKALAPPPGNNLDYYFWRYLPPNYDSANGTKKYPLMIFLHGRDERSDATNPSDPLELDKVRKYGPPKEIKAGRDMCFVINGKEECFIVLSPQLVDTTFSFAREPADLIGYAKKVYRIDETRIFVTGISMGGISAIDYAQNLWTPVGAHVEDLAAIAVAPGGGGDVSPSFKCLMTQRDIPIWACHKIPDTTPQTLYSDMQNFVNAVNSCSSTKIAFLTGLPADGDHYHNSWDRFYATTHQYFHPNVYEWLLRNPKTANLSPFTPGAFAGTNRTITTSSVTLVGEGKDNDGGTVTYQWSKVNGGSGTIVTPRSASTTVTGLTSGTYVFRLQVTDNDIPVTSGTDEVTITVNLTTNNPPIVGAGFDKMINLPASTVSLDGSGSDPEGPVTFLWSKRSGPSSYIFSAATSAATNVSNLVYGVYTFRLTVTDNAGVSRFDDVKVTVNPAPAAGKKTWYSWNMDTQSGASQPGKIISDVGALPATLEFYESTNDFGVIKGSLFPTYNNSLHPDPNARVRAYWATGAGEVYTYVGKSSVARGEEPGETNVGAPVGAFDVQMHPPNSNHQTVAAFVVPEAGSYYVNNLSVRRVSNLGGTVEFKVYDSNQLLKWNKIAPAGSQAWVRTGDAINLGSLNAGQRIYFAVESDGDYFYDMTEVSFSVTSTTATAASADQQVVVMDEVPLDQEVQEYRIAVYNSYGRPVSQFTKNATEEEIRAADFRDALDQNNGFFIFRITDSQNRTEVRKIVFRE